MIQDLANRLVALLPLQFQTIAKQFIKFGITGTIGAVVDFSTYTFLTRFIGWTTTYSILGLSISAANNVSVFLAIVSNFIINKFWTFKGTGGNVASQGAGYFVMNIITWTLNQLLMSYFTYNVPILQQVFGDKRDFIAKMLAIGIILFLNFFGSKFFIFKSRQQAVPQRQVY